MQKVVDISTFDKTVDFYKVKSAGYVGVIIRAGYGQTHVDDYFYEHIQGANEAGLPAGLYWFSYAYSVGMAREEARKCIELAKKYKIQMPIFWDFEYDSDRYAKSQGHPVSNPMLNQMTVAFCSEVHKAGYQAGIYFNKDYRDHRFDKRMLKQYVQWYAYYNKELDEDAKDVDLWQYTSEGEVDGIPTENEDLNYLLNSNIILKGSQKPVEADKDKVREKYVKGLQMALNASYGLHMPVDGIDGEITYAGVRLNYLYYTRPTIKNAHVSWLQDALNHKGFKLTVDGSYGPKTAEAVGDFQYKYGLIIDKYAGVNTHKKLLEVIDDE